VHPSKLRRLEGYLRKRKSKLQKDVINFDKNEEISKSIEIHSRLIELMQLEMWIEDPDSILPEDEFF